MRCSPADGPDAQVIDSQSFFKIGPLRDKANDSKRRSKVRFVEADFLPGMSPPNYPMVLGSFYSEPKKCIPPREIIA